MGTRQAYFVGFDWTNEQRLERCVFTFEVSHRIRFEYDWTENGGFSPLTVVSHRWHLVYCMQVEMYCMLVLWMKWIWDLRCKQEDDLIRDLIELTVLNDIFCSHTTRLNDISFKGTELFLTHVWRMNRIIGEVGRRRKYNYGSARSRNFRCIF